MEHLLPPGAIPPIHIPYILPLEGIKGPSNKDYQDLMVKVVAFQTGKSPDTAATVQEQYEVWLAHCQGDRLLHLCSMLLGELFFGQSTPLLGIGDTPEVWADFLYPTNDGMYLSTAKLPGYLEAWREQVEGEMAEMSVTQQHE